jgi:hypothetical protein
MANRDPITHQAAFSAVSDMEDDVCDLRRVASLLIYLAEGPSLMDPGALYPIASMLSGMGDRLHKQFNEAFDALKVQA